MPLKKVQRGQSIKRAFTASVFNSFVDAANAHQSSQPRASGKPWRDEPRNTFVRCKNNSAEDVGRYGVLGVEDILISADANESEFLGNFAIKGGVPDLATHCGRYVIAQEPIAAGSIGRCTLIGLTPVKVQAEYGVSYGYADAIDGDHTRLREAPIGIGRIWYQQPGTGDVWALILLGDTGANLMRVSLNGSLASGTAEASLLDLDTGVDTGVDITVRDVLGAFEELRSGHECLVQRQGCLNVVKQAGCAI